MAELEVSQLRQAIEDAFSEGTYPGDDLLVRDNSNNHLDVVAVKQAFLGKHWQEVPFETLNRHRDDLPAFTPKAFYFYLPAFLIAAISYPISIVDVLPENLVYSLTPWGESPEQNVWVMSLVDATTPQQKKVIREFIERQYRHVPDELKVFDPTLEKAVRFWRETTGCL